MRTRVKICGITRREDAESAIEMGADALGFVFYEPSPRNISIERAIEICDFVPPFVTIVGLFVNAEVNIISDIINKVRIDLLQFHGDEDQKFCSQFNKSWIKAIRVNKKIDMKQIEDFKNSKGFLLVAFIPDLPGGTGQSFDWDLIPTELARKSILAGGLTADNVEEAIDKVCPYAVDVSGGVESSPGIKDPSKISEFMKAVRNGERFK